MPPSRLPTSPGLHSIRHGGGGAARPRPAADRGDDGAETVPVAGLLDGTVSRELLVDLGGTERAPGARRHRDGEWVALAVCGAREAQYPRQVEHRIDLPVVLLSDVHDETAETAQQGNGVAAVVVGHLRGGVVGVYGPIRVQAVAGVDESGRRTAQHPRQRVDNGVSGLPRRHAARLHVQVTPQRRHAGDVLHGAPPRSLTGNGIHAEPDVTVAGVSVGHLGSTRGRGPLRGEHAAGFPVADCDRITGTVPEQVEQICEVVNAHRCSPPYGTARMPA